MPISAKQIGLALAGGRLAVGTLSVAKPDTALTLFGVDPSANNDGAFVLRLFASRELFAGALGLGVAGPDVAKAAFKWGMAIDAIDAAASVIALKEGRMKAASALPMAGVALGAVALGYLAWQD